MENSEEITETGDDLPENAIKIIVTEEDSENVDAPENINESFAEEDGPEGREEQNNTIDEETEEKEAGMDETDSLKVPDLHTGRESSLREMDKKHSWLSELEEKCIKLEASFISKIQFVATSNHCQKYLEELSSDDSMTLFQIEFSNLFDKFRTAFIGSQRLLNKVSEITSYNNVTDVENRKIKIILEKERQRNQELQEYIGNLQKNFLELEKQKIALQSLFSAERGNSIGKDDQVTESKSVVTADDEADAKIRQLEDELELLNNELAFIKQRESMYQNKIQQAENTKSSQQKELNYVKCELQIQTTRAEKAEAVITDNAEEINTKNITIRNMTEDTKQIKLDLGKAKEESKRLFKDLRKCQKELDGTGQVIEKLRRDLGIRDDRLKSLTTQRESLTVDLMNKQTEVFALKGDVSDVTKERNSLSRRVVVLEERSVDAENKLEDSRKESAARQKEMDLIRKELEESGSRVRELTKQKDGLTEEVLKYEQITSDLQSGIKVYQDKCSSLEKDLEKSKFLAEDLKDNIKILERTKERMIKEALELNKNIFDLRGEIKRIELNISDMKKSEAKLRQRLDEELDKCRILAEDERHSRKLLAESKREVEQLRDLQIMLKKQIEQLKNYNQDLDEQCKKMNTNVNNLTEQLGNVKESYKQEIKNSENLNAKLKRKDDQLQLLMRNLSQMENFVITFRRKIKNLLEEKNVQNSKIIEKDRQLNELKENIRLLKQEVTTLDKSVNSKINDIKLLKIQIAQINRSNALMNEQVDFMDITRQQLFNTQNKLIEEKVKSKALEGEVQRPVNLHRWRILEGIDPERAQLVAKNQALQKQLIRKMTELDNKEMELRDKDKLAVELQEQLRRRSECDMQEQLWISKKELNARMERLKCVTAENDMFQNLCRKYEHEIMTLKNQVREYKLHQLEYRAAKKKAALQKA